MEVYRRCHTNITSTRRQYVFIYIYIFFPKTSHTLPPPHETPNRYDTDRPTNAAPPAIMRRQPSVDDVVPRPSVARCHAAAAAEEAAALSPDDSVTIRTTAAIQPAYRRSRPAVAAVLGRALARTPRRHKSVAADAATIVYSSSDAADQRIEAHRGHRPCSSSSARHQCHSDSDHRRVPAASRRHAL